MKIDPVSRDIEFVYTNGKNFYSSLAGRHEVLSNGNILVTSSLQGRVFLATPENKIIYEYQNTYDENHNYSIGNSQLIPVDYFTEDLKCE